MEDSNIKILKEFAKSTNRSIEIEEIAYPVTGIRTFQQYKRIIYIPNNPEKTSYFVWFSDPYENIGLPSVFCGAFIPLSSNITSKINIRKKNIIDKLKIFSKNNKIGNKDFDSKVVISGSINSYTNKLLSKSRIQYQLLEALENNLLINISLNEYNIDFIPELKGETYLSIINPQSWTIESKDIEQMFKQIEKIRTHIS